MLDASKTVDTIKIRFYIDWLYNNHIHADGENANEKELTAKITADLIDPLNLPKSAKILDLGCGAGYFLDEMKAREYTNLTGVTLSVDDIKLCTDKGHTVQQLDFSFLPQSAGYDDESVDFIFLRQALEHSPFPVITLIEYNRVLKQNSKIYIEVPAPDTTQNHEAMLNHYSVLGSNQVAALLSRTGFDVDCFKTIEFDITVDDVTTKEKLFCIIATKKRALDIK